MHSLQITRNESLRHVYRRATGYAHEVELKVVRDFKMSYRNRQNYPVLGQFYLTQRLNLRCKRPSARSIIILFLLRVFLEVSLY